MYRATTPTHYFCFGDSDPESFKSILITYVQNDKIILEKTEKDLTFGTKIVGEETKYYASIKLSQEETKLFSARPNASVSIQVRALDYSGNAVASCKNKISVLDVLNDEVLE